MLPWLGEMVPSVLQQGPGKSNQPQAMEGRIYASCQKKNKKRRKERHLRKQRNHHRSRQKGRKSQQWARVGVNNRATRGEGEVEKQKCSNPTASSQEGPKGNLSLRVTLPPSWSMHCAGRAPVRGLPRDIGLHCGPGCCGREQSNRGAMEISRDLQVKAASRRRKALTWDVEQYLEPGEELRRESKMKGPSWAEELPAKASPGGAFNAQLQSLKVRLPNEKG